MTKITISYSEAQDIIKKHFNIEGNVNVVIERKDAEKRRVARSHNSQFDDTNIQR